LAFGRRLGAELPVNSLLCLYGDLGAGKTHLIKGIAEGAAKISADEVSSPTFVYLNIYAGPKIVYHFDLYRLSSADEFLSMGFDEYFFAGGICCVEWPERIEGILPAHATLIHLFHVAEQERHIIVEPARET
jgi:tRNA threonylcarbamoyladenosine biosynthesis protein TsaE